MKIVTLVIVLSVLLGSSMAMASVGSSEKTSSLTSDHLINGGFETGTFAGWWVEPDPSVADISETIVHSGLYSAHISDEKFYYNWIQQDVYPYERVTPEQNLFFEGWVYPSRVGKLYGAEYPFSSIRLRFYNETSMLPAFVIHYTWCMSATWYNHSRRLVLLIPCEAYEWNRIARNVTRDIYSYFANTDFENVVLFSVEAMYHYSTKSPGDFYVDDLRLCSPLQQLSTTTHFNLNPNPMTIGETLTLKGFLLDEYSQSIPNETVRLYAAPLVGSFTFITTLVTDEYGLYDWQAVIPVAGAFILVVYYPGSESYKSSYNFAILIVQ